MNLIKLVFVIGCISITLGCGIVYAMLPSKAEQQRQQLIKKCVKENKAAYTLAGVIYGDPHLASATNELECRNKLK